MLLLLDCTAPVAPDSADTAADTAGPAPYTLSFAGELALPGAMDVWGRFGGGGVGGLSALPRNAIMR